MKKLVVLALSALLVVAFTLPASALEAQFGGYFRTRFWTAQNFTGEDQSEAMDVSIVDTRTRLYLNAIFSDRLSFNNSFEFDADWGSPSSYGDIGSDAVAVEVKHSYADINLMKNDSGIVYAKVGVQSFTLARGFLFSDDFAGIHAGYKGKSLWVPFVWIKAFEGGYGKDTNDFDFDYFALAPSFDIAGKFTIQPYVMYGYSKDVSVWNPTLHVPLGAGSFRTSNDFDGDLLLAPDEVIDEVNVYYAGLDINANLGDMASIWATGIYQGGTLDFKDGSDMDVSAYLGAAGLNLDFGMVGIHSQGFYASGSEHPEVNSDDDLESFFVASQNDWTGQSYYWAEIMGYGIFDDVVSNNSPGDKITNIFAVNLGTTIKPMDKVSITIDGWFAQLAEDIYVLNGNTYGPLDNLPRDAAGNIAAKAENELGIEVDLKVTINIVDNLNLDIVGAYLFAGDATTAGAVDDADPYLVGSRLSLSF